MTYLKILRNAITNRDQIKMFIERTSNVNHSRIIID